MAAVRRRERDVVDENGAITMVKRRKMEEEVDGVESRIVLSPCVQATNRGGIVARNSAGASEMSVVIVRRRDSPPVVEEQCEIEEEDSSVSCCSNNRSEEKSKRRIEFVDVEENNGDDRESETSWIYDNFNKSEESMIMDSSSAAVEDVESRRRLRKSRHETVKEAELEDFFQTAEKDLRSQMLECSMKYNFDFEKDEPLGGGRYEWVKLNP
ncbi:Cyclin-dependent kinase inhibitor [Arabidopsis suecica]|uniref:Cyclin-dependent kinase inhibitor n=1 Tax=Arabidopsis suecica TaxID=45249 RepID=A0A8T1ZWS7_ARASU|nr:Cyclin-dependent kinase inhibitor [Arabidopsis suecica]